MLYDRARYEYRGKFAETRFKRDCLAEYAEGLQDPKRRNTESCATGVYRGGMKRKLVAIEVMLLLVGAFVVFQWLSRSAQARWAASVTPQPATAPSVVLESPQQSRWTATATVSPSSSNSATPTNTSLPMK